MRAWGSSSAGGSACNPADRLDHGSKPEQQKRGAAARLAAAPGVRLRCRSGPRTSGRERRGEGLGGCSAVRSEERRVGKEWRRGGCAARVHKDEMSKDRARGDGMEIGA